MKDQNKSWTVRAIGVTFKDGQREERPLEDFTEEELKEIAARKNAEALKAAGYVPVAKPVEAVAI